MLTDKDVLEYVQQVQAQKGDGEERVPGVSTALGRFLTERCGSVANFLSGRVRQAQGDSALDGFARLKKIRRALAALDRGGWERSYHQRLFHEHFINAIVRVLFKTDGPGAFQRAYPRLLEVNEWKETYQECLISTPRRFGKTISVCLFVAALLYSAPNVEISIYSTCKRISQKLLRNCLKFLAVIFEVLREKPLEFARKSMDEVEIIGGETSHDYRKLNSYPSKVRRALVHECTRREKSVLRPSTRARGVKSQCFGPAPCTRAWKVGASAQHPCARREKSVLRPSTVHAA